MKNVQTSEGNKHVTEILQKQKPDDQCRNRTDLRIQARGAFIETRPNIRARAARPSMNVSATKQKATKLLLIPH